MSKKFILILSKTNISMQLFLIWISKPLVVAQLQKNDTLKLKYKNSLKGGYDYYIRKTHIPKH